MSNNNSNFRSFQVAVLVFILFVMAGCSTYPSIEPHQPVAASSGIISNLMNHDSEQEPEQSGTPEDSQLEAEATPPADEELDDADQAHFADLDQIEPVEEVKEQEEHANEEEHAVTPSEGEQQVMNIAITFDDGPDLKYTPRILDILQEKDVKATFFVVGIQVNKYPDVLKRIEAEGHLIGNHSYNHPNLTKLSSDELTEEIQSTDDKIFAALGHVPTLVRPPYGSVNDEVRQQLQDMGKEVVLWNIDPRDWDGSTVEDMFENIMSNARDGGNILLHSFGGKHIENTVTLLPLIIDELRAQGYSFVTVDEL